MNGNPVSVTVWWTPDCGYLHVETDPQSIGSHCPEDDPAIERVDPA